MRLILILILILLILINNINININNSNINSNININITININMNMNININITYECDGSSSEGPSNLAQMRGSRSPGLGRRRRRRRLPRATHFAMAVDRHGNILCVPPPPWPERPEVATGRGRCNRRRTRRNRFGARPKSTTSDEVERPTESAGAFVRAELAFASLRARRLQFSKPSRNVRGPFWPHISHRARCSTPMLTCAMGTRGVCAHGCLMQRRDL